MKIKSLVRPMFIIGIMIVVFSFLCSTIMIWGQYANSLPVSNDYTGFIFSLLCIPIPLLTIGAVLIVFSRVIRKPRFMEKCLWHSWKGCKCIHCGLEDHNWNGCICLKCGEKRFQDSNEKHELKDCICTKCKTAFHEPIWEYSASTACEQVLRCTRCSLVLEKRILHDLQWDQAISNACTQEQRCKRCSTILDEKINHDYLPAEELKKNSCHVIKKCQRCGEIMEHFEHEFEFYKRISESSTRDTRSWTDLQKCKVCGAEETKSDWDYTDW